MRRHGPVIAHCTDSEDFPNLIIFVALYCYNCCINFCRWYWSGSRTNNPTTISLAARQIACVRYDFRIWGQRFFPFFQDGSMPKPFNNIILPLYSGADEAFSHNSNTNTFTPQHQIPRYGKYNLTDVYGLWKNCHSHDYCLLSKWKCCTCAHNHLCNMTKVV